jgi:hypothetical protein
MMILNPKILCGIGVKYQCRGMTPYGEAGPLGQNKKPEGSVTPGEAEQSEL